MTAETIIQSLASGLLMGLLYGLIAAGLALIFGLMDVVNFAHGELLMIAMYVTFFQFAFFAIDPLLAAPLVAAVGCGHTPLNVSFDFWSNAPDRFFPLGLRFVGGRAFVAGSADPAGLLPAGSEIRSIQGRGIAEIQKELKSLVSSARGQRRFQDYASQSRVWHALRAPVRILAIGPGIGVTAGTRKLLMDLISKSESPMVIDADGINSINGNRGLFTKARAPLILTPHPGEMARLLKDTKSIDVAAGVSLRDEIEKDRINIAISFAEETGTHLALKGVPTIIAALDGQAFINPKGNPGMAKGGSGDVLTGMISGFLGVCRNPLQSCILGVYMHGLAGDIGACVEVCPVDGCIIHDPAHMESPEELQAKYERLH